MPIQCPECATELADSTFQCPVCDLVLSIGNQRVYCPKCREKVPVIRYPRNSSGKCCMYCHTRLMTFSGQLNFFSIKLLIAFAVVGVVLLVIGMLLVFLMMAH